MAFPKHKLLFMQEELFFLSNHSSDHVWPHFLHFQPEVDHNGHVSEKVL